VHNEAVAASLLLLILVYPVATSTVQAAPLKRFYGYSSNWAGYILVVGGGIVTSGTGNKYWDSSPGNPIISYTVSYVYGEWKVPTVSQGKTGKTADTSVWVGIDGYASNSNTVEQVGTSSTYDPSTGQISYSAWWEMYPKFSHPVIGMKVNAGDEISAYVKFIPEGGSQAVPDRGTFELSLTDVTTGKSFTIRQGPFKVGSYLRNSVEWIVERAVFSDSPNKRAYFAELAPFGTVTFANCKATVDTSSPVPVHYDRMWMRAPYPYWIYSDYDDAYRYWQPTPAGTPDRKWTIARASLKNGNLVTGGSFTVTGVLYGTAFAGAWPCSDPEGTLACPSLLPS
jgi:hypothetical protein